MARKPKVRILSAGAVRILKGNSVRADIERRAKAVAAQAGPGFTPVVIWGRGRVLGRVVADTEDAQRAESQDRALTRALGAAR